MYKRQGSAGGLPVLIKKHEIFTDKFTVLGSKSNSKSHDIQERIGLYLYKWLAYHILKSDMHYKKYFEQNKSSVLKLRDPH